jgi:hypothetical protein
MKNILLYFLVFCSILSLQAQDIVTTTGQYKSVVLEEFTGIKCTFCPDGHLRAKGIADNYPGRVVLINVHAGGFAIPSAGDPDFRTDEGEELDDFVGVSGYPSGTVNRRFHNNDYDYGRGEWAGVAAEVVEEVSPVNVGAKTTYDPMTRELTIITEVYYTKDSETSENRLIIALTQDDIEGPQIGASRNPDDILPNGLYNHGHMLRDYITGPFGSVISETTQGSLHVDTLVYTLPDDVRGVPVIADDCNIAVYVANSETDIQNGIELGLNDEEDGNNSPRTISYDELTNIVKNSTSTGSVSFGTIFYPFVAGGDEYSISILADAPGDWTYEYSLNGTPYTDDQTLTLMSGDNQDFEININPSSPGIGAYTVTMSPSSAPATAVSFEVVVMHEVTDLIVNSEGVIGGSQAETSEQFEDVYLNAFDAYGITNTGALNPEYFKTLSSNDDLEGVKNIYMNIGWTFPAISDDMVFDLISHVNGGGNLFLAGQDVAWDITQNGGTPIAQTFLRTLLRANYIDDGNASNNPVTPIADELFADFDAFSLFEYYGAGLFYPDQLMPMNGGIGCLSYDGTNKIAAVNFESGTSKTVYLGFGVEMIQDESVQADIMKRVYDYFNGTVDNEEIDALNAMIQVFPNPASNGELNIEVQGSLQGGLDLQLVNGLGQTEKTFTIGGSGAYRLDTRNVANGFYFLNYFIEGEQFSKAVVIENN